MPKYALIADYDYPDDFCIISANRSDLEEIALSIFYDDWYEWFCCYITDGYYDDVSPEETKMACFQSALDYAWHYDIKPVTNLDEV